MIVSSPGVLRFVAGMTRLLGFSMGYKVVALHNPTRARLWKYFYPGAVIEPKSGCRHRRTASEGMRE
jgi:hypothetical protein